MEEEANEVWNHLHDSPVFFLHVYAELKTNQFDYKAHFPCFSPSHPLTYTCNSILNDIPSYQHIYDDYGQKTYPTTLLENIITYQYYSTFEQLKADNDISLPFTFQYRLLFRQKKQLTMRCLVIPMTFTQCMYPPAHVSKLVMRNLI